MKKLTSIIAISASLSAISASGQILIDFNDSRGSLSGTDEFTIASVANTTLGSTGISLTFSGDFTDSGSGTDHSGAFAGGDFDEAAEDYFFVRDPSLGLNGALGTLEISGLTAGSYLIEVVSSVNSSTSNLDSTRIADIMVNGSFADSGPSTGNLGDDFNAVTDGNLEGTSLVWAAVAPTAGTITLTMQTPAGGFGSSSDINATGFLNSVRITAIPEPSTWVMLGGLAIFLGLIRLRRR